jgi:multicomponent Na+:H+ antiporter subunit B
MISIILRSTARVLLPLLLLFAVFLFMRGHNEPGGGFAAGLVAAAAWSLYAIAYSAQEARRALHVEPRVLIGAGLLVAAVSGLVSMAIDLPFLTGVWTSLPLTGGNVIDIGTPLIFDLGVFLAVLGVTLTIIFALAEEE